MSATCIEAAPTRSRSRMTPARADFFVTQRSCGTPGQSVVEAWLVVHGLHDSARCLVVAEGFDDGFHFGDRSIRCVFSPASPGQWQAADGAWRWAVSAWRGPADGAASAVSWMQARFAGIRVRANTLPAVARS